MEEGDDPNFVSDTNNLITIKQKGPTLREIRDTDMGAAITYLLLDLEGVDTEPDILDDGKKGPWTIFATGKWRRAFILRKVELRVQLLGAMGVGAWSHRGKRERRARARGTGINNT
eukprot:scaffold28246_cov120-Isochrysis_galbana.AAC.2